MNDFRNPLITQVFMSVVWRAGQLSVAYYDVNSSQLHLMPDTLDSWHDHHIMTTVLKQVQPTCIIVSSKQDDNFVRMLKHASCSECTLLEVTDTVFIMPSLRRNRQRLFALKLSSMPSHFTVAEKKMYINSLIPMDNERMIQAGGALMKYVDKLRVGVELESNRVRVPVLNISVFSLDNLMMLDKNAFSVLQIFQSYSHPSAYKAGSSKEGLIAAVRFQMHCRGSNTVVVFRSWFLQPSRDLETLTQRHNAVAFLSSAANIEMTSAMSSCIGNVTDVSRILTRMTKAEASITDWKNIYKTVYAIINIADICSSCDADVDILIELKSCVNEDLYCIAELISSTVDFDESAAQNRFKVKLSVNDKLDELNRTYSGLPDFMTKVASRELDKLNDPIKECNVIYLPQLGYLLAIPAAQVDKGDNNYDIENLEFTFLSNNMLHYRSANTKELDSVLGDIQCEIIDNILHKLQDKILLQSQLLIRAVQLCAQLDCLLSFACCAKNYNYCRPEIVADQDYSIVEGRHPLQELCRSPFVPNNFESGNNSSKVKVFTGPNASGKSVYLKQVALIVYMAHIGCFVPAKEAKIQPTDRVFTHVQGTESVSTEMSSFMMELNQMTQAVRYATVNSLVIMDEFGRGTNRNDGEALLTSCINHFLTKGRRACPHVLVSTHFHSLFERKLIIKSDLLSFQTLEVHIEGEELVFLYQVVNGVARRSYACHIAGLAGLPAEVVQRGSEVFNLVQRNEPVLQYGRKNDEVKRCEAVVTKFLKLDLNMESADIRKFLQDSVISIIDD
ncbi:hypothetical protein CAPTEDRAFT_89832 [Capitella teleta]|uniref:DNA mismatch repair proteins mutS family domain-containing protein n=1 Tax=Capitella teleta TaxID=283909 RepID=R7TCG1_CAPTE|nr:hypothetical protein CAPTEDRAFT_89832 [Capitella teleta]|eukprot:ELT91413.1 hypothetical protein CAPTEDRAFT_89832 [Capitella teleta]